MAVSSFLKMQLGNDPASLDYFVMNNAEYTVDSISGSNIDDLTVLAHFKGFFAGYNDWMMLLPPRDVPPIVKNIGIVLDSFVRLNHPIDTLSLACFTEETLKNHIAGMSLSMDGDPMTDPQEWYSLIMNTDIADLNAVIQANAAGNDEQLTVINQPITLKITRASAADKMTLPPIDDSFAPPYSDAFDKVKARLVNNVSALAADGLVTATYHADGDYITLTASCYMTYVLVLVLGGIGGGRLDGFGDS